MTPKQGEVIRQLGDGFAIAWDTNVVSQEVRDEFRQVVEGQLDALGSVLGEGRAASSGAGARGRRA